MNIAVLCILIMGLMPILFAGLAKFSGGGFNNRTPRESLAKLKGWRARANWVQINSFEAFPLFAAAVFVAMYNHAASGTLNMITILIVILRLVYSVLYIANMASLRSMVWFIGLGFTISLFFI